MTRRCGPLANAIKRWARSYAGAVGINGAAVVVYRRSGARAKFLLGHHGGPLCARKDPRAWMVPKGPIETGQAPLAAAQREFAEEAGLAPSPISHPLAPLRKAGGELILGWTREGELDLAASRPGRFEMEWSPRSGRRAIFQKIDPIAAFDGPQAIWRVLPSQAPLIREGLQILCEPP